MNIVEDAVQGAAATVARPFLPWLILAAMLAVLGLAGGSYYAGWSMRGDREAANQLKAARAAAVKLEEERKRGDGLALELEQEKQNIKTVTVEVVKEVPKYTTVYVEKPGEDPKPIPPAVITWGAVGLWNDALAGGVPDAPGKPARPAGATDLSRAPVDTSDLLSNEAINAGKYAECRATLNKLIDWHEGKKAQSPQ